LKDQTYLENFNNQKNQREEVAKTFPLEKTQKINYLLFGVLIFSSMIVFGVGGYFLGKQSASKNLAEISISPTPSITPTTTPTNSPTPTPTVDISQIKITQKDGAILREIKYKLPTGWKAEITEKKDLFISPGSGGFLAISVWNYPKNIGRREYFCLVTKFCIEGVTYFTEMSIGNISGYSANALDNSGGGGYFFGAKGDNFYLINELSPSYPAPNEFDLHKQEVLDSLVFP